MNHVRASQSRSTSVPFCFAFALAAAPARAPNVDRVGIGSGLPVDEQDGHTVRGSLSVPGQFNRPARWRATRQPPRLPTGSRDVVATGRRSAQASLLTEDGRDLRISLRRARIRRPYRTRSRGPTEQESRFQMRSSPKSAARSRWVPNPGLPRPARVVIAVRARMPGTVRQDSARSFAPVGAGALRLAQERDRRGREQCAGGRRA